MKTKKDKERSRLEKALESVVRLGNIFCKTPAPYPTAVVPEKKKPALKKAATSRKVIAGKKKATKKKNAR